MAQSKSSIHITLEIDDKGTATLKKVSNEYDAAMKKMTASTNAASRTAASGFDKMKSGMTTLRANWIALTAAITGFAYAVKKSIDAYLEQERAEVQLANAMKLAGNYSESAMKDMVNFASSLQMVTRYSDDTILKMMNLLQTYRLSTRETKWATQAALDFATATGSDAEGAARLMGMAMQGNIERLARYIPALRSATNEQIKSMSVTEKVQLVIKTFNEQFGGRAQAEMASYGAQLERLRNVFGEIEETVGKALVNALINVQSKTGDTTESFQTFAQIGANAAYVVTIAFKALIDTIRGLRSAFDLIVMALLKLESLTIRAEIGIQKLAIAYDKWKGDTVNQRANMLLLADAQQRLIDNQESQTKTTEDYNEQQRLIVEGNKELEKTFAELDILIAGYGQTVVKTGKQMGAFATTAKDATKSVMVKELTDEMKTALNEYFAATKKVSERIQELSLNEYDYKVFMLGEYTKELKQAGISEVQITELAELEMKKIRQDSLQESIDKQKELTDKMEEESSKLRDTFKDIFLEASADDFDNWLDRIGNKLKNFVADMAASFVVDMFSGGKTFNFGSLFGGLSPGGTPGGMEGPLQESGQFYQASGLFSDATRLFSGGVSKFVEGFGPAGLGPAGIALAVAKGLVSFAPSSMKGDSLFKGYGQGFKETWNATKSSGPFAVLPSAVGATMGFLGFHPFAGAEAKHQEAILKRAAEFYGEYETLMKTSYGRLTNMADDFNYIMSARHIEALEELGHINEDVAGAYHATAIAMREMNSEASKGMGVSVNTMRQLETVMTKTAEISSPEAAQKITDFLNKTKGLFEADIFKDFTEGLLSLDDAIKRLMRTGLSQLDAQVKLLGEDYESLMVMIDGSIPAIDQSAEMFNELYEIIDKFDDVIKRLPDSLKGLKKQLIEVSYDIRYLANMSQSFLALNEDWDDAVNAAKNFGDAIKEADFEGAARELTTLQNYALDASSAIAQLANAVRYLGNKQLASQLISIASSISVIAGFLTLGALSYNIINSIKELGEASVEIFDKWALWKDEIKDAKLADVISNITGKMREWEEIISRATIGDIRTDLNAMMDDLNYSLMEINRLADSLNWDDATRGKAIQTAIEAYTIEIEKYFDAVLKGFSDLRDEIKIQIQEIGGGRTGENIWADMIDVWKKWQSIDVIKDPDEWLSQARELRDLIIERYQIEKQKIEETVNAYKALYDTVSSALLGIQTGGLNPQNAGERLGYYEQEAARLRGEIAGESNLTKRAGLQGQLVSVLGEYLSAAEEYYQRPSTMYKDIYESVVSELQNLQTEAQNQITAGEQALINLQNDTINQLKYIDLSVANAEMAIDNLKNDTINQLSAIALGLNSQVEAQGLTNERLLRLVDLFETRFPVAAAVSGAQSHQGGIPYVPYDNYRALLHRGEAVIRAEDNKGRGSGAVVINLNVSSTAASGKTFIKELKQEIRYGEIGNVILEKIKKAG